jgi:hypothetical protein
VRALRDIVRRLSPFYGEDCPVVVAVRVGWPDQDDPAGDAGGHPCKVREAKVTRTALILVGRALGRVADFPDSALYDAAKPHVLRPRARAAEAGPGSLTRGLWRQARRPCGLRAYKFLLSPWPAAWWDSW